MENTRDPQSKGPRRTSSFDAEAWERFMTLLNPDRDLAALEHERVRQTLVTFFRSRHCWDPEQCADETIDRTVRRIEEVQYLLPFMRGVARNVALELQRSRQLQLGANHLKLLVSTPIDSADIIDHERHLQYLERCLQFLAPADREFILAYHCYDKAEKIELKKTMAQSFGISRQLLRVRAHRLRRQLARRFRAMCPAERVLA
jgi:DNA-directed RNA polymerase specialized sigma24 family protein